MWSAKWCLGDLSLRREVKTTNPIGPVSDSLSITKRRAQTSLQHTAPPRTSQLNRWTRFFGAGQEFQFTRGGTSKRHTKKQHIHMLCTTLKVDTLNRAKRKPWALLSVVSKQAKQTNKDTKRHKWIQFCGSGIEQFQLEKRPKVGKEMLL